MLKRLSGILFFLAISLPITTQAQVWTTTERWDKDWEQRFAKFVASYRVNKDLFVGQESRYKGIRADCADASFGIRAIFAYENGLPFAIVNPSGSRSSTDPYRNFHNEIDRFDYISIQDQKVVEFINYIGLSVGSENLTRHNTFPLALKKVTSGDMFTYRIKARFGKYIRHVYNIKNVNPTGSYDVIYSTQAIASKGLPMIRREQREFVNVPHTVWGFRRFRWPEYLGRSVNEIPAALGYSQEQYIIAEREGGNFFNFVSRLVRTRVETPQAKLKRSLNSLCIEARARISYVDQGLDYLSQIGGRCMNYQEYDAYSTPARDAALRKTFEGTKSVYREIVKDALDNQIDPTLFGMVQTLFTSSEAYLKELKHFCPVEYAQGKSLGLAELLQRQNSGRLSSHPNDTLEHRWGEPTRISETNCKIHY
jgi:hypothetical protein